MTLLRDLIDIPEAVHHSDFVISLTDGIDKAEETVSTYVVTHQIVECFDEALGLISSVVQSGSSKGAYLHGSFGAGKSHFMAVLNLLLQGNPHARGKPELADVVAKYDPRLAGKRFLLVPYHMVGAASMEAGVLGGYVKHVRRLHPEAPLPGVYVDNAVLEQARHMRSMLGDEQFFQNLGGSQDDEGFGELASGWDAARFDAAIAGPPGDPERTALVGDFIDAYSAHTIGLAAATGGGFIPFNDGLNAISVHAKSLGYDAVILFLDELILWFASRMANPDFVNQEGQKVAKLVEAASAERPAPIVSFIARQRDLRDFLGKGVPGAERLNFADSLDWWESRFDTIELSDTNLRAIVEKRLLKPKNEAAKAVIDGAFDKIARDAGAAFDTLMTSEADLASFRRVYPFSPALIETLVAVSGYLQRERTALRLLLQLLVDKRDELSVGDIVPLGDLYDVIRGGEEPFSDELKRHFLRARDLYQHKIRPVLLAEHELRDEAARHLPAKHAFRTNDRLVKTLLLAALVPDVAPLRGLTVRRLTHLNHGTITSPIPGAEAAAVHAKLREWAPEIPELRVEGDDHDPTISLKLSGVDIQSILDQAAHVDNVGARRRKIKDLVTAALELNEQDGLLPQTKKWTWRGSSRTVDVVFANVRDNTDIPDGAFRADRFPRVIIDFPFDDAGHGPNDDLARINSLKNELEPTLTVAWLPLFFTEETLRNLGRLVVLDHVLSGDRLSGLTAHLSPQNRIEARQLLENTADSVRQHLRTVIRQSYGIETPEERWVQTDLTLVDQFPTLHPALTIQPPVSTTLDGAFEQILDQMMSYQYPKHPEFESEVQIGDLRKALKHVERAVGERDWRVEVPQLDRRAVRKVLGPLKIADTGEAHIALDRHWKDHFHRLQQDNLGHAITVERLKKWIDSPQPMGLEDRVANLVISSYALIDNRILVYAGQTIPPAVERLEPATEVRTQELPSKEDWEAARPIVQAVFGVDTSPIVNAANVSNLVTNVREDARQYEAHCRALVDHLLRASHALDGSEDGDRLKTAKAARDLLTTVLSAGDVEVIRHLAAFKPPTSHQAMGRSKNTAEQVGLALDRSNLVIFDDVAGLPGSWGAQGKELRNRVIAAVEHDELSESLPQSLEREERLARDLVTDVARELTGKEEKRKPVTQTYRPDTLESSGHRNLSRSDARPVLEELARRSDALDELEVRWRFRD